MIRGQKRRLIWISGLLLAALVLAGCQHDRADRVQPAAAAAEASPTALPPATKTAAPDPTDSDSTEPVPGPTPVSIAPANDAMVLGDPDAPVTIVEFSDYQCPYCASYVANTWSQIRSEFIDTGRVRYVFKDYPLSGLHPRAPQAHAAARCAGDQGAYWGMHDRLFRDQSEWGSGSDPGTVFEGFAADLGLEANSFQTCLESGTWDDAVDGDVAEGASLGVRGTPTFFVNGYPLVGARPFELFEQVVELAEEGTLGDAYRRNE
jgi:protein-disulfide isomerase